MYEIRITANDPLELDECVRSYVGETSPPKQRAAAEAAPVPEGAFCALDAETVKKLIGCLNVAGLGVLCDATGLEFPIAQGPISTKREQLQRRVDRISPESEEEEDEPKPEPEKAEPEAEPEEDEPKPKPESGDSCVACGGTGESSKGGTCTPCGGTGTKGTKGGTGTRGGTGIKGGTPSLNLDTAEPVTIEDIRAAAVEYIGTGDGSDDRGVAVGEVFNAVAGTRKLTAIDEEHYSAIMAKLSEL